MKKHNLVLTIATLSMLGIYGYHVIPAVYNLITQPQKTQPKIVQKQKQESPLEQKLKSFQGFEHVDQYDSLINKYTNEWNQKFSRFQGYQTLDVNLIKSMICQESGSHQDAFSHDPMQIANQGDFALKILRDGSESGIPGYPDLQGIRETPRKNNRWDYTGSKMTPELSIKYGIRWLIHKAQRFNKQGQSIGFRPWPTALQRYNGSQKKQEYAQTILNR
ncbi:MAG: hypothetical protein KAT77_04610 [Nanoarchaeota archaeon]|nr:hypothetical protein [Nanoarchaeota archaeon]